MVMPVESKYERLTLFVLITAIIPFGPQTLLPWLVWLMLLGNISNLCENRACEITNLICAADFLFPWTGQLQKKSWCGLKSEGSPFVQIHITPSISMNSLGWSHYTQLQFGFVMRFKIFTFFLRGSKYSPASLWSRFHLVEIDSSSTYPHALHPRRIVKEKKQTT